MNATGENRLGFELEREMAALEVPLDSIAEAFRLARAAGVRTVLNAAPAQEVPAALLGMTDVVICNEHELGVLRDLLIAPDGTVSALMVEQDGAMREVEPAGMRIEYVSAA